MVVTTSIACIYLANGCHYQHCLHLGIWIVTINLYVGDSSYMGVYMDIRNNQSETVLENAMEVCERFRVPTRISTDHGTENATVARAMLEITGAETNPVFTGRSVHN